MDKHGKFKQYIILINEEYYTVMEYFMVNNLKYVTQVKVSGTQNIGSLQLYVIEFFTDLVQLTEFSRYLQTSQNFPETLQTLQIFSGSSRPYKFFSRVQ